MGNEISVAPSCVRLLSEFGIKLIRRLSTIELSPKMAVMLLYLHIQESEGANGFCLVEWIEYDGRNENLLVCHSPAPLQVLSMIDLSGEIIHI